MSTESFIHLGNEVITIFVPTNKEIPSSVLAADNNIDDHELQPGDIDFDIEGPTSRSWDELEGALDTIQNAFLFSSQHGEEINSLVMKMQILLSCTKVKNHKQ